MNNVMTPREAEILDKKQESDTVFTLRLQFSDKAYQKQFEFHPGQFNMLYLYGVGEVAISIVSDPQEKSCFEHTIRAVGRVTRGLCKLNKKEKVGIRGPFGKGWPLQSAIGKNITIISGGIGCAPVVSVINYIMMRRDQYQRLKIFQGIKHNRDMIFSDYFLRWKNIPNTEVIVAADKVEDTWHWSTGRLLEIIQKASLDPNDHIVMMCGPEMMMKLVINELLKRKFSEKTIFFSMERNMECGVGLCGHCQMAEFFICKDGPIFCYDKLKHIFNSDGF